MVIFCNKFTDKRLSKVSNLIIIYSLILFSLTYVISPISRMHILGHGNIFKHLYELMFSLEIIRDSVGSQPPPV